MQECTMAFPQTLCTSLGTKIVQDSDSDRGFPLIWDYSFHFSGNTCLSGTLEAFSVIQSQEKLLEYPGRRKQGLTGPLRCHQPPRSSKSQPTAKRALAKKAGDC